MDPSPLRVIVAESEPQLAAFFSRELTAAGFRVCLLTYAEAEAKLFETPELFSALIVRAGAAGGWSLGEAARRASGSLFIAYTYCYTEEDELHLAAPGSHLFEKPFNVQVLIAAIAAHVELREPELGEIRQREFLLSIGFWA